jgi:RNA polymerase sigma-70 factor (ECF subfamily)
MDRLRRDGRDRDLWKEITPQTELESSSDPASRSLEIREALDRLEPATKAILTLRHIEGFEIAEISEILGVPEGTVKSRLHRAKEQLRTRLEMDKP